jgi:hypothetical protein
MPPHHPARPCSFASAIASLCRRSLAPRKRGAAQATPAAIPPSEKMGERRETLVEKFITIYHKLFRTLTNSEQLTDFRATPAEPLFMRFAKGKAGEKKTSG